MHAALTQLSKLVRRAPGGSALVDYVKITLTAPSVIEYDPVTDEDILKWMRFINPGMLDPGNLLLFAYCVQRLPSTAPLIEIGSFAGLSLNHLIHLLRHNGKANPVFSVDEWKFEGYRPGRLIDGSSVPHEAYRSHVIETFRRNVTLFSGAHLPHHIELASDTFFAAWGAQETRIDFFGRSSRLGGPIALAYIDGDHTYAQCNRDFENVDRYLEKGGFIIFDDSADGIDSGSARVAKDASSLARYELVAKNPNYCLRKRVG
jgi:hypothetical protein